MPLFQLDLKDSKMLEIPPHKFADVKVSERQDLQRLLRDNPSALGQAVGEELLIISEEYSNWEESDRRVDLLALDQGIYAEDRSKVTVNLVVIELKVAEKAGHAELQSIRYAAMLSNMSFGAVIETHREFSKKISSKVGAEADNELLKFLEDPDSGQTPLPEQVLVSKKPRIILISPSFSKEITTTVLWLNEIGLDIQCLEATPYKIDAELYLDLEQVIPLPQAKEYMVQRREKTQKEEKQASVARGGNTVPMLVTLGVLKPGDRLYLRKPPRPDLAITDEKARWGTFTDGYKIRWDKDGQDYSPSGLCREICKQYGGDVGSGAFQGPNHWALEGQDKTLAEMAMSQASKEAVTNEGHEK